MKLLFFLLLAASTSTFALGRTAEKKFDLICTGNQDEKGFDVPWHEKRFLTTFHVDLGDGSFCFDFCENIYKLTRWNTHELSYAFDVERQNRFREPQFMPRQQARSDRFTVTLPAMKYRRDYKYETCSACPAAYPRWEKSQGTCRKAPFSGLSPRPDSD